MVENANIGYLFQRDYYEGLSVEIYDDKSKDKTKQASFFKEKNDNIIKASKRKIQLETFFDDAAKFELRTIYPGLVTGIGMMHETGMMGECKLGMAFDYSSGLPYIPGSSVKGLLRSMFPMKNKLVKKGDSKSISIMKENRRYLKEILKEKCKLELNDNGIDELATIIFDGKKSDGSFLPVYERDVFFDAQIEGDYSEKGFLGFDYITPHKDPLKNPNPIKFLKILPNVKIVFRFKLNETQLSSSVSLIPEQKLAIFEEILKTVGIGAKTNVGYGQLK